QLTAVLQPLVAGGVGDHGGDIQLVSAVVLGLGENVIAQAHGLDAVAVGLGKARPTHPWRVPHNGVELPIDGVYRPANSGSGASIPPTPLAVPSRGGVVSSHIAG